MKLAAFNVENLFDRAKAFNEPDAAAGKDIIKAVAELNQLMEEASYTAARKARMLELLKELGLLKKDEGEFVWLRRIRGGFLKRPRGGGAVEVVANGRDDWIGWVEHKSEPVNEIAVMNTGRVIRDVNADVLAVVEAEDRVALSMFVDHVLAGVGNEVDNDVPRYRHVMVIDGNDDRGIDVGIMSKPGFEIETMRSHVDDVHPDDADKPDPDPIFSRDSPEYAIRTPGGNLVWVIPNHFKSKFGGDDANGRRKRKRQAARVAQIYKRLVSENQKFIAVLGDLNDTPGSAQLEPLLSETNLKDVSEHPTFDPGAFAGIGTFGLGNNSNKIDYLLLSPALFSKVRSSGLFRKGAWPGVQPPRWEVYPELKKEIHAASDHHVIFADIDID